MHDFAKIRKTVVLVSMVAPMQTRHSGYSNHTIVSTWEGRAITSITCTTIILYSCIPITPMETPWGCKFCFVLELVIRRKKKYFMLSVKKKCREEIIVGKFAGEKRRGKSLQ